MNEPTNNLKSAEEFFYDWTEFFDTKHFEKHELVKVISQIQLNAYKAGMRRAAEVMEWSELVTDDGYKAYKQMKGEILTLSETIKEEEME